MDFYNMLLSKKLSGGNNIIKYLKSHGTEYIITDILPDVDIDYELEFFFDFSQLVGESWKKLFGGGDGNTDNCITFGYNDDSGYVTFQKGSNYDDSYQRMSPNYIYKITSHGGCVFFDGKEIKDFGESSFSSDNPISIFGVNYGESVEDVMSYCFINLKLYDNKTLVADFVPAENNGKACLFDKVSEQYYHNQGTGNFEIGEI